MTVAVRSKGTPLFPSHIVSVSVAASRIVRFVPALSEQNARMDRDATVNVISMHLIRAADFIIFIRHAPIPPKVGVEVESVL